MARVFTADDLARPHKRPGSATTWSAILAQGGHPRHRSNRHSYVVAERTCK